MSRLNDLAENFSYVLQEQGAREAARRLALHAKRIVNAVKPTNRTDRSVVRYVDVCFINGTGYDIPHPIRYRVEHQMEQLEACGMSSLCVNAWELTPDVAALARVFVIFRCPHTPEVERCIKQIHSLNKRVLFDVDDLVFDTAYTDNIPYLATMTPDGRAGYDELVRRMGMTLDLCDGAITTTPTLARELSKRVNPVLVNKNVASEEMHYLSERAVYERDVLPALSEAQVPSEDAHRWKVACRRHKERTSRGFTIGYFSGSITHNDDVNLVLPALARFMRDYPDARLHVVGELDLPEELTAFGDRIVRLPFIPWRRLPQQLSFVDVNLIPLADTLFNAAKSENKWVEAALVKVPSIASKVGRLAECIEDGVTGLLCASEDNWYGALVRLHNDASLRASLAEQAYLQCSKDYLTATSGMNLAEFLTEQMTPSIAIAMPRFGPTGGVAVAMRHASILQKAGYDTMFLDILTPGDVTWKEVNGTSIPSIPCTASVEGRIDKLVATMWPTLTHFKRYDNIRSRYYLVQGFETNFYEAGDHRRIEASATYGMNPDVTYCTVSPWCQEWLRERFHKEARLCPNGIDLGLFPHADRDWSGKIRVLIEGNAEDPNKNIDEAFRIADKLDRSRFEVWLLSNLSEPKSFYHCDKYFSQVPHDQVGEIYSRCHVLLKTSLQESFSYPPLEMMATGGIPVALRNGGNLSYLVHGYNSLLFEANEDDLAAELIECVATDAKLRTHLIENGHATALEHSWERLADRVLALYE